MVTINQVEKLQKRWRTPWPERIVRDTLEHIGKWKIERYLSSLTQEKRKI